MAADLAHGDQPILAGRRIVVFEGAVAVGLDLLRQLAAVDVLAQRKAAHGVAAGCPNDAVAADHGDRARRSEIEFVVESREVGRVDRSDHHAADGCRPCA